LCHTTIKQPRPQRFLSSKQIPQSADDGGYRNGEAGGDKSRLDGGGAFCETYHGTDHVSGSVTLQVPSAVIFEPKRNIFPDFK
jgi:hypothetical protein